MTHLKINILLIPALILTMNVEAQQLLTLEHCRELAIENNKSLKMAEEEVNKATYQKRAAFSNYLPKFSAAGTYMYNSRNPQLVSDQTLDAVEWLDDGVQSGINTLNNYIATLMSDPQMIPFVLNNPQILEMIQQLYNVESTLTAIGNDVENALQPNIQNVMAGMVSVQQPLFAGGKIIAYNKIANDAKEVAKLKLDMQQQEVSVNVDKTYWQIVSLAAKAELTQKYVELLQTMTSNVEVMVAEGVATESDHLAVKVKLNEAEVMLIKANNGLALSRMLLCQQCGLPLDSDIILADEKIEGLTLIPSRTEYSLDDIEDHRPELKCLSLANDIYRHKISVERAEYLPTIAAFGNYIATSPSCFNGIQTDLNGFWNFGVMAKIPLFHWGEGYNKVKMAKAEQHIAELNYEETKEKIMLQVSQCEKQIDEADARLKMSEEKMSDAEENLRMATIGFSEGVVTASVLNQAQTAWLQAHSEHIDAKVDRIMADVYLRKAVGNL